MVRLTTVLEIWREKFQTTAEPAKKYPNLVFSRVDILLMVAQNPIIFSIF